MVRCYNLLAEIGKEDRFTAKEIEFLEQNVLMGKKLLKCQQVL